MPLPRQTATDTQPTSTSSKPILAMLALPKVFVYLLVIATILSVLSMFSFLAYVFLPQFTHSSAQTDFPLLYTLGIIGLAIAEACQIGDIVVLIALWLSKQNTEKKPREIAVLVISLIPYMVILVFLVTLIVYLYLRRKAASLERLNEAKQELKEQTVDTIVDYGTNLSSSLAPSTQVVAPAHGAVLPSLKDALRQVIGPTAAKSVSGVSNGLLVSTVVVLVASTAIMGGVAIPQTLQRGATHQSPRSSPKPGSVEYISLGGSQADAIIAAPNGNLWFLGSNSKKQYEAGLVTPLGNVKTFPLPLSSPTVAGSLFQSAAVGADGNLWFTDWPFQGTGVQQGAVGFIGRVTTTGAFKKFPLPIYHGQRLDANSIALGADGSLWFTVLDTHGSTTSDPLGRITPTGAISFVPTHGYPDILVTGGEGNLWFSDGSSIGRVTASGSIREFTSPTSGFELLEMTAGPDGKVWFYWHFAGADQIMVGDITSAGKFELPLSAGSDNQNTYLTMDVTVAPGGTLLCGNTQVGTYSPSGTHLEPFSTIHCGGSLVEGKNGLVWFTTGDKVGYIVP